MLTFCLRLWFWLLLVGAAVVAAGRPNQRVSAGWVFSGLTTVPSSHLSLFYHSINTACFAWQPALHRKRVSDPACVRCLRWWEWDTGRWSTCKLPRRKVCFWWPCPSPGDHFVAWDMQVQLPQLLMSVGGGDTSFKSRVWVALIWNLRQLQ